VAKRNLIPAVGSGADTPAVKGSHLTIARFYPGPDGTTWIHATPEEYYIRATPPPPIPVTIGQYYWLRPVDPKGDTTLVLIPAGAGDIYYSDLVQNHAIDPASLLPAASPAQPAWSVALGLKQDAADLDEDTADLVGTPASDLAVAVSAKIGTSAVAAVGVSAALGNGSTDAAATINALAATVSAAGGGLVSIPAGTFRLEAPLDILDHVKYVGAGIGATILKMKNGVNTTVAKTKDFDTLVGGDTTGGPGNWALEGVTIDGNSANNLTKANGLEIYGYSYSLRDVVVRNTRAVGIKSEWWSGTPSTDTYNGLEAKWYNVKVHHCVTDGVIFNGPHDSTATSCEVFAFTGTGVAAKGLRAVRCHVWGATGTTSWKMVSGCHLTACEGEGASAVQFLVQGSDQEIDGCYAYQGSVNAAQSYGVQIGDGSNTPTGYRIDMKILDTGNGSGGGAVNFANDGGKGKIEALIYQNAGTMIVGTPHSSTAYHFDVSGAATAPTYAKYFPAEAPVRSTAKQTFDGDVTLRSGTSSAFRMFLNAVPWVNSDSLNKLWAFLAGTRTRWYSDVTGAFSGQTYEIDGATGFVTMGASTGPKITYGSGSPEGVVTAPIGSEYHRTDGGAGTAVYVKESGTGNTGWVDSKKVSLGLPKQADGTQYLSVPGVQFSSALTRAHTAGQLRYYAFEVRTPITVSKLAFEVSTAPASNANVRVGLYAADADLQPTGAPLTDQAVAVASGFTGVKSVTGLSIALPVGRYVICTNMDVTMTLRAFRGGITGIPIAMGATPFTEFWLVTEAYGALNNPGTKWTGSGAASTGTSHSVLLGWD
jgi:hypothetical protein